MCDPDLDDFEPPKKKANKAKKRFAEPASAEVAVITKVIPHLIQQRIPPGLCVYLRMVYCSKGLF